MPIKILIEQMMAAGKPTPKDLQVMASIIKEIGVEEYEPRLLNQMLEFTYRYVTTVLDDALVFSNHAKKKNIDVDDVKLAIQLQMEKYFTSPPPREILIEIAKQKNNLPLPAIKSSVGLRLPPDRYSLTACNYRLKSAAKKARIHQVSRLNIASLPQNTTSKINPSLNLNTKNNATLAVVTKPTPSPTVTIVPRTTPAISKPPPTPIIKFSEGNKATTSISVPLPQTLLVSSSNSTTMPPNTMPSFGINVTKINSNENNSLKRKKDDDLDDFDGE